MSFKVATRPAMALAATALTTYALYKWKEAKETMHLQAQHKKEMLELFDRIDTDHKGKIDKRELREALRAKGIKTNPLTLDAMLRVADEDHDGFISRQDWLHFMERIDMHVHVKPAPPKPVEDVVRDVMREEMWKETHGRHDKRD